MSTKTTDATKKGGAGATTAATTKKGETPTDKANAESQAREAKAAASRKTTTETTTTKTAVSDGVSADPKNPSGDKTFDGQPAENAQPTGPTPTQITEHEPNPNVPDEIAKTAGEPKLVRHDVPPGSFSAPSEKVTVVEEVKILDPSKPQEALSEDLSDQINKMRVAAHAQGLNQTVILGQKKNADGVMCNEQLTVLQDGRHTTDLIPVSATTDEDLAKAKAGEGK